MIKIPRNIAELVVYQPGKRAEILAQNRHLTKIAKLSSNENTLGPSPLAVAEMKKALTKPNWYPDPAATELRGKIAQINGTEIENVIVGNGSEGLLLNICRAFFEEDDELLTSKDTFVAIYIMAKACGINCQTVPMKAGYRYDLDRILDSVNQKTKVVYLANPNNPTGTMFDKGEFNRFMSQISLDTLVVLDAAYHEYAGSLSLNYPESNYRDYPNILVLRTFSKAYGLAGMRLGYGIGDRPVIDGLLKVKLTFEPSVMAQAAGIGALDDHEFLAKSIENNRQGLEYFYKAFSDLGLTYFRSFSNFVMIEFDTEEDARRVDRGLLKRGVIVRPLKSFGLPRCIRITVGQPTENEMCVEALQELLQEVK